MLEQTFCHIYGIGEATEEKLWKMGVTCWNDFLEGKSEIRLTPESRRKLTAGILESRCRLDEGDHNYFRQALGTNSAWRAFETFRDDAVCLDIETTGLSPDDNMVTTVCLHSDRETKAYVAGKNLNRLQKDLDKYKYLVTFNGIRFDIPFLKRRLNTRVSQIHLDLMYPLRTLGYQGGLKSIEKQLGLQRDTDGVGGMDAVYLWHAYKNNTPYKILGEKFKGQDALNLLVEYNTEDTVNLMQLAEITFEKMREKTRKKFPKQKTRKTKLRIR